MTDTRIPTPAPPTEGRTGGWPDPAPPGTPELRLALVDGLARLAVEDRAVLVLRHADDHSVETVAAILGVSVPAVKMRSARALSRLRALLGEDFPDR